MSSDRRRRLAGALLAVVTLSGVLTACSGDGDSAEPAPSGETRTVRLLLRDGTLRALGSPCAGSGGYLYVHHKAEFRIESGDGETIGRGALPAGTAVKALDKDFGNAPRVPSFCEFAFPVSVSMSESVSTSEAGGYRLMIADGGPIELKPQDSPTDGALLVGLVP
jgi:hypothetical protein